MEIKQLEILVSIINNRSFTKTAQQLFLSQPTISFHLSSLERELGVQLLVRSTKEIYPSRAGLILYEHAAQILRIHDQAAKEVQDFENMMAGELVIGASSVPANYFLPEVIADFRRIHPDVSFQVQGSDSAEVINNLVAHKIEIGLVGSKIPIDKCVYEHFADDRVVLIAPNTGEYRRQLADHYSLRWLLEQPFIAREVGSGTRRESEAFISEMGFNPQDLNIIAEISDTEGIIRAVAQGMGISIVSELAAESYRQLERILVFNFEQSARPRKLYLARRKNDPLTPIARAFFAFSAQYYRKS